jgi:hypothetical protein
MEGLEVHPPELAIVIEELLSVGEVGAIVENPDTTESYPTHFDLTTFVRPIWGFANSSQLYPGVLVRGGLWQTRGGHARKKAVVGSQ